MSRDAQAAANRALMPETARIVDAHRAAFGKNVRVIWAEEGGRTVGTRPPVPRSMTADQWIQFVETGEKP